MILILLIVSAVAVVYYLAIKPYSYWDKKNVKAGKVTPVFGDSLLLLQGKESLAEWLQRMYNKVPDGRYVGIYQFQRPVLLLRCPDLIKQMFVKDSDYFLDHTTIIPAGVDELWANNLVALKGQAWKAMRTTLSPTFTSSKMKAMFSLIYNSAEVFVQHFLDMNGKILEVDFKDHYARYSNDIIASVSFGVQVDSLKDRENEFFMMGKAATTYTLWRKLIFISYQLAPKLSIFFQLPFFNKKMKSFFINLVKDTIQMREEQNYKRPDMIGLLIEAKKGIHKEVVREEIPEASFAIAKEHLEMKSIKKDLTDLEIAAQTFIFFVAGSETTSTAMCLMCYELAINPDIQKRLVAEIDRNKPHNGPPSYETIVNMTYMDMVLSETLRKWPSAIATDRVPSKPYTIQPELPDEKPVHLDETDNIFISIYGIHRDPEYYENPEKFDPERFSHENRKNIKPYTYLPFGVGARNCIGSRLALLEIKTMFFCLLSHFEVIPIEKTQIPVKLSKLSLNLAIDKDLYLGLKRRS